MDARASELMKLLGWFRGSRRGDEKRQEWRRAWEQALPQPASADLDALRHELHRLAVPGDDVEVETEMLDALVQLRQLQADAARGSLPLVETQHRVVGTEPCHFTMPASLSLDAAQSSGRLLVTPTRVIFVGAGRTHVTAWHTVHDALRVERDVALLRADRSVVAHFRLNTYSDALAVDFLARHFRTARRARL